MKQGDSVLALQQYTTTSESPKILSKKRGAGHLKSSRALKWSSKAKYPGNMGEDVRNSCTRQQMLPETGRSGFSCESDQQRTVQSRNNSADK